MMTLRKKIKRGAVYHLSFWLIRILNAVPRTLALLIGSFVGLLAWRLLPKDRYRISRHLTLAFGDRFTPIQKQAVGRKFFINTGKNLTDVVRFRKHFQSEIRPLVDAEGMEHFDAAHRRGRGVIGVTGHIGNFELLAVYMASCGYEVAVIGRRLYDPRLDRLLVANREAMGLRNFATTDSPRLLLDWLKQGKVVGVLIDTDSQRVRSMHLPAFGRLSNTPVGQSMLALRTGAALVPLACLRTEKDRYRVVIRPEVTAAPGLSKEDAVRDVTRKCTKALEEIISPQPAQWIWLHNRWRTPPQNTA
ncbi:MAG: lysophospholipid acyltransferase family protein [Candidatus Zixiibacteriota bacterium]|nr:MAG: lysophospholipid acyltransferase family protein [candidate division Zixibacteria bacterium]